MSREEAPPDLRYDAFISYSRRDQMFAQSLEKALRAYRPPKDLPVPQRYLRIFRDESDFTGEEYRKSLDRELKAAAKLIVICSPSSASSDFVGEEIDLFSKYRGQEHLIPLLLDGIPNNEAIGTDAARRAFPEPLVRLLPMPLAADYRGFNPARDNVHKGRFTSAWFKTLADIYADYGVDREKIERRERRRTAQRRRTIAMVSAAVMTVVIGLTVASLRSRQQAILEANNKDALRLAGQAQRQFESEDRSGDGLVKTTLLAAASLRAARTVDGHIAMVNSLNLLSRPPLWHHTLQAVPVTQGMQGIPRQRALAISANGDRIAATDGSGPVQLLDARSGQMLNSIKVQRPPAQFAALAFSPDGSRLIVGCAYQACVFDVASGQELARLPPADGHQRGTVWFTAFSPDGRLLATSSYGSNVVSLYDTHTWGTSGTIVNPHGVSGVFSLAFSPSGDWLATGTPSAVQLWRVGKYDAPVADVSAAGTIWSVAFGPDGERLIAAGNMVQAWRINTLKSGGVQLEKEALPDRKASAVVPLLWHGANCLATTTGIIRVMCDKDLDEMMRVPIESIASVVSADGLSVVAEQRDGSIALWSLDSGMEGTRVSVGTSILATAMAEQSGWLAAGIQGTRGTEGGEVVVLDLNTWHERRRLAVPSSIAMLAASSNGRWLAIGAGNVLRVFDTVNWREVKAVTYDRPVTWTGFSAQDRSLIAVVDNTVVALLPEDWSERVHQRAEGNLSALRASQDGRMVAATWHWPGGHDTGVEWTRLFDLQNGNEIAWKFSTGGSNISEGIMQRLAADLKRELTGGDVKVVDDSRSWAAQELNGPMPRVSGDDAWSVDISESSLELTDKPSDRLIGKLRQHGKIVGVYFLPWAAPRWIVTGGADGTVAVWPLRGADLADQACARLEGLLDPKTLEKLAADAGAGRPCSVR